MDDIFGSTALAVDDAVFDEDFALDVRVVDAVRPPASTLIVTSDNCGSTCSGPCVSFTGDPS